MSVSIGQHKAKMALLGDGTLFKRIYLGEAKIFQYDLAVSANLVGCTAEIPGSVYYGEALSFTLVPDSGHQQLPWNTKVTMGGVDITSSVYDKSTGTISISSVTGDITIEAEAVMMPSEYEPVEYVEMLNARRIAYPTSYKPNNHTQMEIVCELPATTARMLFGLNGYSPNTTPSISNPAYWMWIRYSSGYTWMYNRTSRNNAASYIIKTGEKITIKIDEGVLTFPDHEDIQRTINSHVDADFATSQTMMLFGHGTTVNGTYTGCGKLWRWKVSEQDVLLLDWVPVRRKSDSLVGLFDVHTQAVLQIKDAACSIAPNIKATLHYTGCTASRQSAAITGTATQAVIGSTWQIKITPSSGHTFVGGTTPQVLIDGVDVTSQVVTDNGDGTYNVTIANVEDKPIEITAVAVSDGTANATNSVTPMGGNTENNEEEM